MGFIFQMNARSPDVLQARFRLSIVQPEAELQISGSHFSGDWSYDYRGKVAVPSSSCKWKESDYGETLK